MTLSSNTPFVVANLLAFTGGVWATELACIQPSTGSDGKAAEVLESRENPYEAYLQQHRQYSLP
jgi:hypothetical protein